MTNVIVQDLGASTESRVPCRELVKKIAIYKVCVSVCVRVCVCVRACVCGRVQGEDGAVAERVVWDQ